MFKSHPVRPPLFCQWDSPEKSAMLCIVPLQKRQHPSCSVLFLVAYFASPWPIRGLVSAAKKKHPPNYPGPCHVMCLWRQLLGIGGISDSVEDVQFCLFWKIRYWFVWEEDFLVWGKLNWTKLKLCQKYFIDLVGKWVYTQCTELYCRRVSVFW